MWMGTEEDAMSMARGSPDCVEWKCPVSDHTWEAPVKRISSGHGCPYPCCRKNADRLCGRKECSHCWPKCVAGDERLMSFWADSPERAALTKTFSADHVEWRCPRSGHTWSASVYNVSNGHGCPYPCCCAHARHLCGKESCQYCWPRCVAGDERMVSIWAGDAESAKMTSTRSGQTCAWRCDDPDCGHTWKAAVTNIASGTACPACASSKGERLIRGFLEEQNAEYESQWTSAACRDKRLLPFDFLVRACGESRVPFVFEVDGSHHFDESQYGKERFEYTRAHDLTKMRFALLHGYPVVRLTSRAITYFGSSSWQRWLLGVCKNHVAPLAGAERHRRRLIVLEDTPRYRTWVDECIAGDADFEPHVVFCRVV